jgi:hypothetical protein
MNPDVHPEANLDVNGKPRTRDSNPLHKLARRLRASLVVIGVVTFGLTLPLAAQEAVPTATATNAATAPEDFKSLDQEVQALKKEVLDLNRELFVLEEELLFPANTQVAVFLSMDVGEFFALDSVTIKVDNKEVANYLYTQREAEALLKGGVHRVFIGNLKAGEHELIALFTGQGPNVRDYRRGATVKVEKGVGAKYIELKISDRAARAQPEFVVKQWE